MNEYARLVSLILQDSIVATFEYWSEFILRIQRDETTRHPSLQVMFGDLRIPSLFCLRLRSSWWMGDQQEWKISTQSFPIKGVPPMVVEAPLQASLLITALGRQISAVRINDHSDLTLSLSDGRSLTVRGTGGDWEESWFLELPVDDPDRDQWSIVCDSQGLIGGKFPMSGSTSL